MLDKISQITSPDTFARLCKCILSAEFSDFQAIDDSGGDSGNDGYSESSATLFQFYCPEKPRRITDRSYISKIKTDLAKASILSKSGDYIINTWIFITPQDLREPVHTFIRKEAALSNFKGISWSSTKLTELLTKHGHVGSQFPDLIIPDIMSHLVNIEDIISRSSVTARPSQDSSISALEISYKRRIDNAIHLMDQNKWVSAQKEYSIILNDAISEDVLLNNHLRFRIYNNLGVCEHVLDNNARAAELFEMAYAAEPESVMAISKYVWPCCCMKNMIMHFPLLTPLSTNTEN